MGVFWYGLWVNHYFIQRELPRFRRMKNLTLLTLLVLAASFCWGKADERYDLAVQVVAASELAEIYENSNEVLVVSLRNGWSEANVDSYWIEVAGESLLRHLAQIDLIDDIILSLSEELSVKELKRILKFYQSKAGKEIVALRTGKVSPEEIAERFARLAGIGEIKPKRALYFSKIFTEMDWASAGMRRYLMSSYLQHYLEALTANREPLAFPDYKDKWDDDAALHGMIFGFLMLGIITVEYYETPNKNLNVYTKFLSRKHSKKFFDVVNKFEVLRFRQAMNRTFRDIQKAVPNV